MQAAINAPQAQYGCHLPLTKSGDSGESVRLIQKLLIFFGDLSDQYYNAYFGEETKQAVKRFQRRHNLLDDGDVGNETWHKLTDALVIKKASV